MQTATSTIRERISPDEIRAALETVDREEIRAARATIAAHRTNWGFANLPAPILTPPAANLKLEKGTIPSYGITLQHFVHTSAIDGRRRNFCPYAGQCTAVCVLDNGSGRYDTVQRGRSWKNDLLTHEPRSFFIALGDEIRRAIRRDGQILIRPNVNSDLQWELFAPALVDGSVFGTAVTFYGYTKLPEYLTGDGWVTPHYRVAYSRNEKSDETAVSAFLARGGSVAYVTNRRPHTAITQWSAAATVIDADLTDEWVFVSGAIGDLSAKGKARKLIGRRPRSFVRSLSDYETTTVTLSRKVVA